MKPSDSSIIPVQGDNFELVLVNSNSSEQDPYSMNPTLKLSSSKIFSRQVPVAGHLFPQMKKIHSSDSVLPFLKVCKVMVASGTEFHLGREVVGARYLTVDNPVVIATYLHFLLPRYEIGMMCNVLEVVDCDRESAIGDITLLGTS